MSLDVAAILTLLTDFGETDTYVGQMKGSIARISTALCLVDITHYVPAHDVRSGAFLLSTAVGAFPEGTTHLAVVDPGVGSSRKAVAVRTARGDVLVGPDNGLLVPAAARLGGATEIVDIGGEQNWGARRSTTFHGRDLFAPVAARIATGVDVSSLGPKLPALSNAVEVPLPREEDGLIRGEILHVDTYGNLVTNVPAAMLPERFHVHVGDASILRAPHSHYSEVAPGELLALVGSAGYLEVSARDASASLKTHARRGDEVVVERTR